MTDILICLSPYLERVRTKQKTVAIQPRARIDELQEGIYRISTFVKEYGITFNVFLLDDERPALIHTGFAEMYPEVERRVKEVIDLRKLQYVALLHFEADEWGGLRFVESPNAKLVCSKTSSQLTVQHLYGMPKKHLGPWEGDRISLGKMKLRFLMTPHVHHWDSMMVFEETRKALFPSDLFLQQGENAPVVNDPNLAKGMIQQYRDVGIFAHEKPVRDLLPRLERLHPKMIHAMHGSSLDSSVHKAFFETLRTEDFAYRNVLLFEKVPT
mgnify:CR=1 FL=1